MLTFAGRVPWIGRLPDDIYIKRENFTFYFPLATCVLMSVMLTLLSWLFPRAETGSTGSPPPSGQRLACVGSKMPAR